MTWERYPLSGKNPDGRTFPNAYTYPPKDNETAGQMGYEAERILDYWSGTVEISKKTKRELENQIKELRRRFIWQFSETLTYPEYFRVMEAVQLQVMQTGLLDLIDQALGTKLAHLHKELGTNNDMTHRKTHILSTALTLAREVVAPTWEFFNSPYKTDGRKTIQIPGTFVPKARLGILGEYDGVVIPNRHADQSKFDLRAWMEAGNDNYIAVEQKLVLRPVYNTGWRKIKRVFSWDVQQVRQRMGNWILNWEKGDYFPLPRVVAVVYHRGLLPSVSHYLRINGEFWSRWYDDLAEAAKGRPESEEASLALALINIADQDPQIGSFTKFTRLDPIEERVLTQVIFSLNSKDPAILSEVPFEESLTEKERGARAKKGLNGPEEPKKKKAKRKPQKETLF